MKSHLLFALSLLLAVSLVSSRALPDTQKPAGEYAQHLSALAKLSIQVAQTMPADQYGFRPHPESMTFGELMAHIASTNYAFCAGLKDTDPPSLPASAAADKDATVKFLSDSFDYCAGIVPNLTEEQLAKAHNSPDGRLPGRDVLLALYIHVAHHRGQAEIYLRDKGIRPPWYMI
jgi:uncharacterized damage-inducible protein DinB